MKNFKSLEQFFNLSHTIVNGEVFKIIGLEGIKAGYNYFRFDPSNSNESTFFRNIQPIGFDNGFNFQLS